MTSTHLEHPEDLILTGDMSVIDTFALADITMKMDGMSLVWGTNPDNGKFFVCTKSSIQQEKDSSLLYHRRHLHSLWSSNRSR